MWSIQEDQKFPPGPPQQTGAYASCSVMTQITSPASAATAQKAHFNPQNSIDQPGTPKIQVIWLDVLPMLVTSRSCSSINIAPQSMTDFCAV
ncbi:hypothetical protein PCANC_14617 [Puccinia coronata f. sp. avenae]|uniref:Uncharacterized protein n=1 Tax=Puccinia coronata f. sp. avenae TaxID=200324 RepID=A0A2N5SV33_9BASI|nr:hypothetical protein PCANC_14617 [Puccinia coronata f. sp. avenae]